MPRPLRFHLPALLWAAFCAATLLVPSSRLPGDGLKPIQVVVLEYAVHGALAAVLAFLAARSLGRSRGPLASPSAAPLLAFAYLVGLEGAQELVPGRGWGWDDVVMTLLGVLIGAALWRRVDSTIR